MTKQEEKEAPTYWRVSIWFLWWIFQVFGDWKCKVIYMGRIGFMVYDWHPFKPKKGRNLLDEMEQIKKENPELYKEWFK